MAKMCFSLVFAVLVSLQMGSNQVEASPQDGELMFEPMSNLYLETLEMPDLCQGQSYCFVKGDDYPQEKVDKIIENMPEWKVEHLEPQTNIESRQSSYGEPDCLSDSTEDPIFYIIDKSDTLRVVLQSPEKFLQIYSVKWCRDEGRITRNTPHFVKDSHILQKFKIECRSEKMDFNFFVLGKDDPVTQEPTVEIASAKDGIPVCCRCRYNVDD